MVINPPQQKSCGPAQRQKTELPVSGRSVLTWESELEVDGTANALSDRGGRRCLCQQNGVALASFRPTKNGAVPCPIHVKDGHFLFPSKPEVASNPSKRPRSFLGDQVQLQKRGVGCVLRSHP